MKAPSNDMMNTLPVVFLPLPYDEQADNISIENVLVRDFTR